MARAIFSLPARPESCRQYMQKSKLIALKLISAPIDQIPISVARNGEFTVRWQRKEGMSESLSSSWSVGWVPVQKGQQQSHSSLVGQTLVCWITIFDHFPDGFVCAAGRQGR